MTIRRIKDRTELIARKRVLLTHVYERRASGHDDGLRGHYVLAYLWRTVEAMHHNAPDSVGGHACHCINDWTDEVDGQGAVVRRHVRPLVSELHFVVGRWSDEAIAHEVHHLAIHCQRLWPEPFEEAVAQEPHEAEELICYRFGRINCALKCWLWTKDPGPWQTRR